MAIILLGCGPCVVIVNCWDRLCTLGRALRTKETLPDFHEWCRVTRHPRIFIGLMGCQRTPGEWGVTAWYSKISQEKEFVIKLLKILSLYELQCSSYCI